MDDPRRLTWLKGELHCHSNHSPDANELGGDSVERLIRMAEALGLDFLSITDHNVVKAPFDPGFCGPRLTPIPAMEWGIMGHAGIHGVRSPIAEVDTRREPSTWNDQADLALAGARGRGAVVVVNHPAHPEVLFAWSTSSFDAVEIWNEGWTFPFARATTMAQVQKLVADRGLGGVPGALSPEIVAAVQTGGNGFNAQSVRFWESHLARGARIAAVGGGDRHVLIAPGHPTTWVKAGSRNLEDVLDAVRRGRTGVSAGPEFGPIELEAIVGERHYGLGEVVPRGSQVTLRVTCPYPAGTVVRVYKGMEILARRVVESPSTPIELADRPDTATWYRVEAVAPRGDLALTPEEQALVAGMVSSGSSATGPQILQFLDRFAARLDVNGGALPAYRLTDRLHRMVNAEPGPEGPIVRLAFSSPIYVR